MDVLGEISPDLSPKAIILYERTGCGRHLNYTNSNLVYSSSLKQLMSKKRRVVWSDVARKFHKNRINKSAKELEMRLRTLKRAHGTDLSKFPPCFYGESKHRAICPNRSAPKPQNTRALNFQAAARLLSSIFGSVTKADVRQKAGVIHVNAGEVLPKAVATILGTIGPVVTEDIFLAVGSEIGNIVAQIALQTPAQLSIGVEIRSVLTSLSCILIKRYSNAESLLKNGDAKTCDLSTQPPFYHAAIVYLNSFFFVDEVNMFVLSKLCLLHVTRLLYRQKRIAQDIDLLAEVTFAPNGRWNK
ncbi:hypothetical protein F441_14657 [Phytophthora nicotianae CJ01A1]|uniref:DOT1 domain-containing protein n=3 Tax=Phytophthora nicotianae TaxID=4792 RepID=W2WGH9_PHYNI|nr:hypothetical protein F441_14657 [Phytophthora nicotianae CJ01A1]